VALLAEPDAMRIARDITGDRAYAVELA